MKQPPGFVKGKRIHNNVKGYLLIYVDDLILTANTDEEIQRVETLLTKNFVMHLLGRIKYFLGIKITMDTEKKILITMDTEKKILTLNQSEYIQKLLERFNMTDAKGKKTPMEKDLKLNDQTEEETQNDYRQLIGCLMYLANSTRPDIAFAVNYFSRFQSKPNEEHWMYAKHILRYLKNTKEAQMVLEPNDDKNLVVYVDADWAMYAKHILRYLKNTKEAQMVLEPNDDKNLVVYVDADWANDVNTRKSTSGYIIKYRGAIIAWSSRKQSCVALSSTEAEYIALSSVITESIWIKSILEDIEDEPVRIIIHEDNQSCIKLITDAKREIGLKHTE
ncbi:Reverse transcriptase (RNA-dependent DNA polymerase) [Popillia japonica]|uniref:Reverse transcriptase (RNA-dependent DNA polymerase) n=1 Tax=Popillia japonica TaxID=7064 RepID=A0AAW1M2W0_POPJA